MHACGCATHQASIEPDCLMQSANRSMLASVYAACKLTKRGGFGL